MQKLILDTNVIVSALISNSIPSQILYEFVLDKKWKLAYLTKYLRNIWRSWVGINSVNSLTLKQRQM